MEIYPPKVPLPPYNQPGAFPEPVAPLHEPAEGKPEYLQQGVPQYPETGILVYPQNFQGQNQGPRTLGDWSTGLCGCCEDPSNCCVTCCCPCIKFGQIAEVVDRGSTPCLFGGLVYCLLLACMGSQCIYSYGYRTRIRNLYSLKEEPCSDCCVHCWCERCAVCQEYRELWIRGVDPRIGWQRNVYKWNRGETTLQPVIPQGMFR
ncbi:hypothetical protein ACHQM5_017682 [Ranunculus cassubicifolius]